MAPPAFLFDFPLHEGAHRLLGFDAPQAVYQADTPDQVRAVLGQAEQAARAGAWVAGFVCYEAAPAFDAALRVRTGGPLPLAWFGRFDAPREAVQLPAPAPRTDACWQPSLTRERFAADIAAIRAAIAAGQTYQVNHTLRLSSRFEGDDLAWFMALRQAQPQGYCAYLNLGRQRILSASPELFFSRRGDRLCAKPMKGTARRGRSPAEDDALALALANSAKNRAENLMITDLLRNDLSRVALPHSVRVPALMTVERLPTLLQMTSTVTAQARPGLTLEAIFAALFPCGSVTGAPKVMAMDFIARLETAPRGLYCGAIGLLEPGGDAMFSVAIRTVTLDRATAQATCGVGGGIVWDSTADDEYAEALLKSRFLGGADPAFAVAQAGPASPPR